jgi:hypothetical protein
MSEKIKIEDLRIGQKVWHDGVEKIIDHLTMMGCDQIGFYGSGGLFDIRDISLTPPKKTVMKDFWIARNLIVKNGRLSASCLYDSEEAVKDFFEDELAAGKMKLEKITLEVEE